MGDTTSQLTEPTVFNFNFVEKRHLGYALSVLTFVVSIVLLFARGLNYGVEFSGGSVFHYRFKGAVDANAIRATLSTPAFEELGDVQVQRIMGTMEAAGQSLGQEYIIRAKFEEHIAKASAADDIESKLDRALSVLGGGAERLSIERIGPTVGESLKTKAFWCAFLGCLGILLYIWVRFEFRSGVASLVTQVHDCFVILGVFALLQHEFTLDILAALLTVIGFSINGSIMVLDRIRENLRLRRKLPYGELVNLSINQSLARTLNTAVFVQLAVLPLLFIGPVNVRDFALAMTIGVVVGTYSQICVICPILVDWYYRDHPAARLAAA